MKPLRWGQLASGLLALIWLVYAFRSFGTSLLWVLAFGANLQDGLSPGVRFIAFLAQAVTVLFELVALFFIFGIAESGRFDGRSFYATLVIGVLFLTILAVREGWRQWQDAAQAG